MAETEATQESWVATHVVPASGVDARLTPDGSVAPVTRLESGVQLRVLQTQGAWAQVEGSNGWSGWVDGRLLESRTAARPTSLPAVGAVLVLIGSVLPWVSVGGLRISAWEIPLVSYIASGKTGVAISYGTLLLVVVVGFIPFLTHRRLPLLALLLVAVVPLNLALFGIRFARSFPGAGIGMGIILTLVGGVVIAAERAFPGGEK